MDGSALFFFLAPETPLFKPLNPPTWPAVDSSFLYLSSRDSMHLTKLLNDDRPWTLMCLGIHTLIT